jgi:hypothetical protein
MQTDFRLVSNKKRIKKYTQRLDEIQGLIKDGTAHLSLERVYPGGWHK